MTDRERLIELIQKEVKRPKADALADYLLAKGVIVPPCKVGDTDNNTVMAIESLKAQLNGWIDCCRKWQNIAIKSEENIEQIFKKIKGFIQHRYVTTETLANTTDNEAYYAGCSDTYLRVGAYIAELQKEAEAKLKEREG